ncbi:ABC transporter substrate-binding protein [Pseudactinotalea terrae]|uniref:ABC transporter substrate-binding protein n=1 Tax=Pseudactinotalea terrae TaxID=1743262 RepID=UPI0012E297E0|nr:extracellular solute-binding protein [Pseudactinotalea terrae]
MNPQITRRTLLTVAGALGITGGLAACGRGGTGTGAGGSTSGGTSGGSAAAIRFTWWGPTFYQEFTQEMVDLFMAANTEIGVASEPAEWSGYWDRLATQVAANDEPDVINMDGKYLAEYGGRGVLADLEQLPIDLSNVAAADLDSGRLDGTLYALSTGQNAWVVLANPQLFESAGLEIPDDKTWTWDDAAELAAAFPEALPDVVGLTNGGSYADLTIWARQNGEDLWNDEGMAVSADVLAQWFQWLLDLQTSGGTLGASASQEDSTLSLEQQAFATGRTAMSWAWTNQLGNYREASGVEDVVMLRPPSLAGEATENGLFGKASMFWSISARSEAPEAAAALVDFLVNDESANAIQLLNRGVPSNPDMVATMQDKLTETDVYVADFIAEVLTEISSTPAVQPTGSSTAQDVFTRYLTEVRFGNMTAADAAAGTIEEVNAAVASA